MTFISTIQSNIPTAILFWSVFLLSIIISHFYQKTRVLSSDADEKKIRPMSIFQQSFWIFLIIIGPSMIIGLRNYDVGVDTLNNWLGYLSVGTGNSFIESYTDHGSKRPLYFLFQFVIFKLTAGNATIFLFSMVLVTLFVLVKALDKWILKISMPMALFVYYCFFGMQLLNQSRQLMALSIFFLAAIYLMESKKLKFIISVLIACLIHYTAIIALILPLILFVKNRYRKLMKWTYYLLLLLSPFLLYPLLILVSYFTPNSYAIYFSNLALNEIGFGILLHVFPIIIPILVFRKYLKGDINEFLIRTGLLTFPLRLAGYYSYFLMRMYYYGAIFIVLIIPIVLNNIKSKSKKNFVLFLLICLCLIYYVINYMFVYSEVVFPYKSIFSK